jgi:hypothetical protein
MSPEIQVLLWVLASFTIGVVALMALEHASQGRGALWDTAIGGITAEVALFAYYIGLPFAALIAGALSLDLMGLGASWTDGQHIAGFTVDEWLRGIVIAAGVAGFVLMALRLSLPNAAGTSLHHEGAFVSMRSALYEQAHWAFYRAPFMLLLNDAFLGAISGAALIGLEWLAHAFIQRGDTRSHARWWVMLCCLLAGAALFLLTQNLWLMIAADLIIRIGSERLMMANETKNLTGF